MILNFSKSYSMISEMQNNQSFEMIYKNATLYKDCISFYKKDIKDLKTDLLKQFILNHLEISQSDYLTLRFSKCKIDDASLKAIAALLNEIFIKGLVFHAMEDHLNLNPIAQAFMSNVSLTSLCITNTKMDDTALVHLGCALQKNSTLNLLDLSGNKIGESKEASICSGAFLVHNIEINQKSSLKSLDLSKNQLGDLGADLISNLLKGHSSLSKIDLSENEIEKGALSIFRSPIFKVPEDENSTTKLILTSNFVGNALKDFGCEQEILVHEAIEALKNNLSINHLDLINNKIDNKGAMAIAEVLKKNIAITELYLSCNPIGDEGAVALAQALETNFSLIKLKLSFEENPQIHFNPASSHQNNHPITNQGALAFAHALEKNSTLMSLSLKNQKIQANGAIALAKALEMNTSLSSLELSDNQIGQIGAEAFSYLLKSHSHLTSLNLANNKINEAGAIALAYALKENHIPNYLNLADNFIYSGGALAFASVLETNTCLSVLNLSKNRLKLRKNQNERNEDETGIKALAQALKKNQTLTEFILDSNQITNHLLIEFIQAIEENKNSQLRNLELIGNPMIFDDAINNRIENLKRERPNLTIEWDTLSETVTDTESSDWEDSELEIDSD